MKFCNNCGNKLGVTENYCTNCGRQVCEKISVNNNSKNNELSDENKINKSKKLAITSLILSLLPYILISIILILMITIDENYGWLFVLFGGGCVIFGPVLIIISILFAIKSLKYNKNGIAISGICLTILQIILFILILF